MAVAVVVVVTEAHQILLMKQIDNVSKRQSQIIDGFLRSKDKIIEQTGQITTGILEKMVTGYHESSSLGQEAERQSVLLTSTATNKLMIEG